MRGRAPERYGDMPFPADLSGLLGAKTAALLTESGARRMPTPAEREGARPVLGEQYVAGTLPPGSVVIPGEPGRYTRWDAKEYVIGASGLCMAWEQPIPRSDEWRVTYTGRLPAGVWMTHRERAQVDQAGGRAVVDAEEGARS